MIFVIIFLLSCTILPSYYLTLLIWKIKFGSALGTDNEDLRRKIMIRTYILLSIVVLTIFFIYNWSEIFDSNNYY